MGLYPGGNVPLPMVYESSAPSRMIWEYHLEVIDPREAAPLDTAELNTLGQDGWLLAGLYPQPNNGKLHYYFVRQA
jgi:hypothetical protein